MSRPTRMLPPSEKFRQRLLLAMIALGALSTVLAWSIMGSRGLLSPVLRGVMGTSSFVLPVLFIVTWIRLLPLRATGVCCLLYAVVVCAVCMALRMYSPKYGADIDLQPLYLWILVVYVFAFTLAGHRASLAISLGIMALFVCISLPYLVHDIDAPYASFTLQLYVVSAALIAALYFFSGYQHRLQLAQHAVDQLASLSNTDELTGLPNRRCMAAAIDAELASFEGQGSGFALMLFDIDHFKTVNDRFGHAAGDEVLMALATPALRLFRDTDDLGRWGGDEFVALVRDISPAEALRMANALCRDVAAEPVFDANGVTISCGVTVAYPGDNIDSLLSRADAALYAAKHAGRNRAECMLETDRGTVPEWADRPPERVV